MKTVEVLEGNIYLFINYLYMRGRLTESTKLAAIKTLGHPISLKELRLMPYLQYCLMNSEGLESRRLNEDDIKVLELWKERQYISGDHFDRDSLTIHKTFYDAMCEILYWSYIVDSKED